MAVTSFISLNISTRLIVTAILLHLLFSCYCLNQKQPPETIQGLLVEGKTRLGSTPPSCYNKCNNCHPCMAVQVPTMPSHDRIEPAGFSPTKPMDYFDSSPSSAGGNRYSNYKPLGWKCRCGGHFYNP